MNIELSKEEATALLQLIHIAVQARGMEVAEAGVVLAKKIKAAAEKDAVMRNFIPSAAKKIKEVAKPKAANSGASEAL